MLPSRGGRWSGVDAERGREAGSGASEQSLWRGCSRAGPSVRRALAVVVAALVTTAFVGAAAVPVAAVPDGGEALPAGVLEDAVCTGFVTFGSLVVPFRFDFVDGFPVFGSPFGVPFPGNPFLAGVLLTNYALFGDAFSGWSVACTTPEGDTVTFTQNDVPGTFAVCADVLVDGAVETYCQVFHLNDEDEYVAVDGLRQALAAFAAVSLGNAVVAMALFTPPDVADLPEGPVAGDGADAEVTELRLVRVSNTVMVARDAGDDVDGEETLEPVAVEAGDLDEALCPVGEDGAEPAPADCADHAVVVSAPPDDETLRLDLPADYLPMGPVTTFEGSFVGEGVPPYAVYAAFPTEGFVLYGAEDGTSGAVGPGSPAPAREVILDGDVSGVAFSTAAEVVGVVELDADDRADLGLGDADDDWHATAILLRDGSEPVEYAVGALRDEEAVAAFAAILGGLDVATVDAILDPRSVPPRSGAFDLRVVDVGEPDDGTTALGRAILADDGVFEAPVVVTDPTTSGLFVPERPDAGLWHFGPADGFRPVPGIAVTDGPDPRPADDRKVAYVAPRVQGFALGTTDGRVLTDETVDPGATPADPGCFALDVAPDQPVQHAEFTDEGGDVVASGYFLPWVGSHVLVSPLTEAEVEAVDGTSILIEQEQRLVIC